MAVMRGGSAGATTSSLLVVADDTGDGGVVFGSGKLACMGRERKD